VAPVRRGGARARPDGRARPRGRWQRRRPRARSPGAARGAPRGERYRARDDSPGTPADRLGRGDRRGRQAAGIARGMTGCEFLSTDGTTPSVVGEALGDGLQVTDTGLRDSDRTYYDTFDGLLRGAGLSVAHEDGELALVDRDSGLVRLRGRIATPGQRLFPRELDPGPLRDALLDVVEERALLALARVHARRRALSVLDDERKTVVRMTLEEPALVDSAGRLSILRPRVRLAAVRGYDGELGSVKSALTRELGLAAADQPLVDEAVSAAGRDPAGISSKISVPLQFDERSDVA